MTVNFNEIPLKDIEGNEQTVSISAELGNIMYMRGIDIEECELGSAIYHHHEIDLSDKQVQMVKKYIGNYPYVLRKAIEGILS